MGVSLGLIGANNKTFVDLGEQNKASLFNEEKAADELDKIKKLQADAVKNGDKATAQQAELMRKQLEDAVALQKMMQKGIEPMQKAGLAMASVMTEVVDGLTTLVNWFFKKPTPRPVDANTQKLQKQQDELAKMIDDAKQPGSKITKEDIQKKELEVGKMAVEARQSQAEEKKLRLDVKRKENALRLRGNKASEQDIQEVEILKQRLKDLEENNKKSAATSAAAAGGGGAAAPKEPTGGAAGGGGGAAGGGGGAAGGGGGAAPQPPGEAAAGAGAAKAPGAAQPAGAAPGAAPATAGAPAPPTAPPPNVKLQPEATMTGVDSTLLGQFYSFAKDWGRELLVNSAVRTDEKQAELYVRKRHFGEPGIHSPARPKEDTKVTVRGKEFAVPGSGKGSKHREGDALDISGAGVTDQQSAIDEALAKHGLVRPLLNMKDPPHVEMKKMADGGITRGPSIVGEAGPEAVIPLKFGSVPVDLGAAGDIIKQLKPIADSGKPLPTTDDKLVVTLENAIRSLASQLSQPKPAQIEMLEMLRELKRVNDENMDISGKIARNALN
jgi:hypothetical protein